MKKKPELLAPAGSMESVYAAVRCGADGVYAGGKRFSARANAVNFSDEELKTAADYCHLHGVKFYIAMNTVIFDSEMQDLISYALYCAEIGVDGIILQDPGAAAVIRSLIPRMPLHASTQMTIHTKEGARAAAEMGFCRVVPARELTLSQIEQVAASGLETEVFVHGAQCMCLSGQCYMSAAIGTRSANRGQCAQCCRLPFSAEKREERCALSLKDMSLLEFTDALAAAGADSFKIEGRMKRPEYVAAAVTAFRKAIDGEIPTDEEKSDLRSVFSRSGFTDGYLTGKRGSEMFGSRRKEDVTAAKDALPRLRSLYENERKSGILDMEMLIESDKPAVLKFSCGDISGKVTGSIPERAVNRPLTADDVKKQLSKLGGTRYECNKIRAVIGEGLTLPTKELNRMRREAAALADSLTIKKNTPVYSTCSPPPMPGHSAGAGISFRLLSDSAENVLPLTGRAELLLLPLRVCEGLTDCAVIGKTAVMLPCIVTDEECLISRLKALRERGFVHFVCGNFTHLGILRNLENIIIHGGQGLNITNSYSIAELARLGFADCTVSFELRATQTGALHLTLPAGIRAYGRLPLMTVLNCPVRAQKGCKNCTGHIIDRMGKEFPVRCEEGYARIYNCDILETSDILDKFGDISFAVIDVSGLDTVQAERVLTRYERREKPSGNFTRGLYRRGIDNS